ncbi:hypothetical protein [Paenibacillus agricola]|uniref:Rhodanese domain-containing protein n=1 Tax=Paenibacillus agricola TaxID=2716264 RepID=A0ABX0J1S1_9BACL|nr:hypothetical protein [Paenibacillus agricola]NHN29628.1 hypothetical protein [Paenibacillus agricola]
MKISEVSFRNLDRQFIVTWDKKVFDFVQKSYEIPKSDAIILRGYIDHECGFSFVFTCYALMKHSIIQPILLKNFDSLLILRSGYISDCEFSFLSHHINNQDIERAREITDRYYDQDEFILDFRNRDEFDLIRADDFPDDVKVYLIGDNKQTEEVWCRVERYNPDSQKIVCKLLNMPYQIFTLQEGDCIEITPTKLDEQIVFYWQEGTSFCN